jgi:ABC-3C biological conflict system middle component
MKSQLDASSVRLWLSESVAPPPELPIRPMHGRGLMHRIVRARSQLHHAAFDERQLSYASTGTRFANRRQRLQHDVALLVADGLVALRDSGFSATPKGHEFVGELSSLYASQFRASVRVIHSQFKRLSDTQLAKASREWLQSPSLILDLYGSSEFEQVGANG